jgi:cysteinyl-tRNA synthetase
MHLYNTLTRREEEFQPGADRTVRMYTCGLTVYSRGHIGNFRTFVFLDVLRRTLKYHMGFNVREVMNFTDVDDRTINGAQKAGMPLREYTDQYIAAFIEDAQTLGLEKMEETPRATDEANLRAMADIIHTLETRGHTYDSDGSVYFKISTMPSYGRLARLDQDGLKSGARVDSDSYAKEDARDFVLWKGHREGEPSWEFPDCGVGPGRPGWHIECSAMALRLLGPPPIDIHAGGVDLIFPHHENEIAQSEGATGQTFSRFWVHCEHLIVDDEKMSKSMGNVFTVKDIVDRGFRPSALRYLLLSTHYRKQLKFSWTALKAAEESLRRVVDSLERLGLVSDSERHPPVADRVAQARLEFGAMLEADVNVAGALGVMFDLTSWLNAAVDNGQIGVPDVPVVREAFAAFDHVLGVISLRRAEDAQPPMDTARLAQMLTDREEARRRRDFAAADRIRGELLESGVVVEDTPAGTKWKRK